jgi:hypothetical protein
MLKDRIKEWSRQVFGRLVSGVTADYTVGIRDPATQSKLGSYRQHVAFVPAASVHPDVNSSSCQKSSVLVEEGMKKICTPGGNCGCLLSNVLNWVIASHSV